MLSVNSAFNPTPRFAYSFPTATAWKTNRAPNAALTQFGQSWFNNYNIQTGEPTLFFKVKTAVKKHGLWLLLPTAFTANQFYTLTSTPNTDGSKTYQIERRWQLDDNKFAETLDSLYPSLKQNPKYTPALKQAYLNQAEKIIVAIQHHKDRYKNQNGVEEWGRNAVLNTLRQCGCVIKPDKGRKRLWVNIKP